MADLFCTFSLHVYLQTHVHIHMQLITLTSAEKVMDFLQLCRKNGLTHMPFSDFQAFLMKLRISGESLL